MAQGKIQKVLALTVSALTIILYVVVRLVPGVSAADFGLSAGAPLFLRLAYPFFHAGAFHLLINVWVFLSVVFLWTPAPWKMIAAYLAAVLVPVCCLGPWPTAGLSVIIYFLLGDVTVRARKRLSFCLWCLLYIVIGFFLPHVNALIHLYAYLCGILVSLLDTPLPTWRKK